MPLETTSPTSKKRPPAYYWWTLVNVFALCLAVLTWVLCLHVFRHPEIPRNYELLKKLGRVDPPEDLEPMKAPPGESADPQAFYRRYAGLAEAPLLTLNAALMRNYLQSLREPKLIQYAEGDYRVLQVRELTEDDFFHPGFAVQARAMIAPDEFTRPVPWPVVIEYLFPTDEKRASGWISPGDQLKLQKFPNCAAVLHVARVESDDAPELVITLAPTAFGNFEIGPDRKFTLQAPKSLNPGGPLPVFPQAVTAAP